MRERPVISDKEIRCCLRQVYGLAAVTVEFLPFGLDTRAGVFRVVSAQGISYLLKVKSSAFYAPSLIVPRYLRDLGCETVVAPIRGESGELWTLIEEWSAALYQFVDGITTWEPGLTRGQWRNLGAGLKQIHESKLPSRGFEAVRRESFDPSGYRDWVRDFETRHLEEKGGTENERRLRAYWIEHKAVIHAGLDMMEETGRMIRRQHNKLVVCHADLHPGNIIRNEAGEVYLVDWDDVMLGLKERDFLFVNGILEDGAEDLPFSQGYGETWIDWGVFTYYMWERLITDVITCVQDSLFRHDLEEETKTEAVDLFAAVLREDNEYGMAKAAELLMLTQVWQRD